MARFLGMKCCNKLFVCPVSQDIFSQILAGEEHVAVGADVAKSINHGREVVFVCGPYRVGRTVRSISGDVVQFYK